PPKPRHPVPQESAAFRLRHEIAGFDIAPCFVRLVFVLLDGPAPAHVKPELNVRQPRPEAGVAGLEACQAPQALVNTYRVLKIFAVLLYRKQKIEMGFEFNIRGQIPRTPVPQFPSPTLPVQLVDRQIAADVAAN